MGRRTTLACSSIRSQHRPLSAGKRHGGQGRACPPSKGFLVVTPSPLGRPFRRTPPPRPPATLRLVAVGVVEDAARAGEALPRLAMALGAEARGRYGALGLEPAATALELEHRHRPHARSVGVVRKEAAFRGEALHADGHLTLLGSSCYTASTVHPASKEQRPYQYA